MARQAAWPGWGDGSGKGRRSGRRIGRTVKHLGPAYARLSTGKDKRSGGCRVWRRRVFPHSVEERKHADCPLAASARLYSVRIALPPAERWLGCIRTVHGRATGNADRADQSNRVRHRSKANRYYGFLRRRAPRWVYCTTAATAALCRVGHI